MATTATNKQPLLIDRVFHNVISSNTLTSGSSNDLDIVGTNESAILVECSTNDGGIIEDLYTISRTGTSTAYAVLLYLSTAIDYLRPNEAVFVGSMVSSTTGGTRLSSTQLPKILAPVPAAGTASQLNAFYVPKGYNLWVTLQTAGPINTSDTPIIGAQGGFY